jgi:hypothetical protein
MPKFESPQFTRNIPQQAQRPLKEFNVGIPTEEELDQENVNPFAGVPAPAPTNIENVESQLQQAHKEKANVLKYGPRITEHAKRRIEILSNIGRLTRDVKIGDTTFSLRTLKSKEAREAMLDTLAIVKTDLEASYESRKRQLAKALFKIDGEDIQIVLGTDDPVAIMALIDDQEETVTDKLWSEFVSLKEEAKTKYGINTTKQTEEVATDLKKS